MKRNESNYERTLPPASSVEECVSKPRRGSVPYRVYAGVGGAGDWDSS